MYMRPFTTSRMITVRLPTASLATASLAGWDQRLDQSPFVVGQIARISQLAAVVTGAVLARPHRWPLLESGHHPRITDDPYDSRTLRTDTKNGLFSRPVVIYKKLSHGFY